jgi:hypothetical protein
MKTLLRKTTTGLYFQGPDRWTPNPAEALNFNSIDRLLKFVRRWKLQDVELAFAFTSQPAIKRLPLESMVAKYSED